MRIEQVLHPDAELVRQLMSVWESSVRATHHFLSNDEITAISHYLPQALTSVAHLIVARKENNEPVGLWEFPANISKCSLFPLLYMGRDTAA